MSRCGAAYLGYTKESKIVKASKTTRSSTLPPGMPTADWVALASLRDHLNDLINYSYNMGIPFLKDIPVLGFLGSPKLIEPLGGINWPGDLYNMLKAVGYTKVANNAAWEHIAPAPALDNANAFLNAKYHVLMLIHAGLYDDTAGTTPGCPITGSSWTARSSTRDRVCAPGCTIPRRGKNTGCLRPESSCIEMYFARTTTDLSRRECKQDRGSRIGDRGWLRERLRVWLLPADPGRVHNAGVHFITGTLVQRSAIEPAAAPIFPAHSCSCSDAGATLSECGDRCGGNSRISRPRLQASA